jgi:GPH family glycoside/pentoside/hexuronide:cation symporter
VSLYLLFFYTDVVGLSAAVAGAVYMIASIWDGATDPLMGIIADRTRTRNPPAKQLRSRGWRPSAATMR